MQIWTAERVPQDKIHVSSLNSYYLPTHGVVKSASTTTKLLVVFDTSAKTSSRHSLNDCLLPGLSMYPKLIHILVHFWQHRIGLSSDISKMFREIELHTSEHDLHRFLVQTADGTLQDWRMKRLTFGVKSSPFLASLAPTRRQLSTESSGGSAGSLDSLCWRLPDWHWFCWKSYQDLYFPEWSTQQGMYDLLEVAI